MNIEDYLSTEYFKSRKQLVKETGLSDREIRARVSKLKKEKAVIYNSQTVGYRLAKEIESLETVEEAQEELALIKHCINDIKARTSDLAKSKKTYIAYLKRLEDRMLVLENMQHIPII